MRFHRHNGGLFLPDREIVPPGRCALLGGRMLMAAGGGGAGITLTATASPAVSTANSATHTFSAAALGDAAADRVISVAVALTGTGFTTISGVTVAGNAATQLAFAIGDSGTDHAMAAIYAVALAAGTTGDVVVTLPGTIGSNRGVAVDVFRMVGGAGATAFATGSDFTDGNTTAALGVSVNTAARGAVIACGAGFGVTGAATWSGLTETADRSSGTASMFSAAGDETAAASTPLSASVDFTNGGAAQAAVAVSFSP